MTYSPALGKSYLGFGGGGGLSYTCFFNFKWGLRLGAEAMVYNARYKTTLNGFYYENSDGANPPEPFEFRYALTDYVEKQTALLFNIPLMVIYQKPLDSYKDFYAALGGKVGLPMSVRYKSTIGELSTSAYYDDKGPLELFDPESQGFGFNNNLKAKGKIDFGTSFMLSAEAGFKWYLDDKYVMYTGVYADYGLNNADKSTAVPIVHYAKMPNYYENRNAAGGINTVLAATHHDATHNATDMVKRVVPLAAGIKITFALAKSKPPVVKMVSIRDMDTVSRRVRIRDTLKTKRIRPIRPQGYDEDMELYDAYLQEHAQLRPVDLPAIENDLIGIVDGYTLRDKILNEEQIEQLNKVLEYLSLYPDIKVSCDGHTCDIGGQDENYRLGMGRATIVRNYLIQQGMPRDRITIRSYWSTRPRVPNESEKNRQLNRRVEIKIDGVIEKK
ncbi:hypothetical protein AGMMS4956_20750 [Bacteroidia bacterium]|nr:hypothetical protein AGMMS4956_20750 [Bacteroidia bacterium]